MIIASGAQLAEQRFCHFHVVVDHIGVGGNHFFQRRCMTTKIGNQNFDLASRQGLTQTSYAVGKKLRPSVRQIITRYGRYDHVTQIHLPHGIDQMFNFFFINRLRLTVGDMAVKAMARTDIAEN